MDRSSGRRPLGGIFAPESFAPAGPGAVAVQAPAVPEFVIVSGELDLPQVVESASDGAGDAGTDVEPDESPARIRTAAVYLPAALGHKARVTCSSRQIPITDLVVEAINAHLPEIRQRLQPASAGPAEDQVMPTRAARAYRKRARIQGGRDEVHLRLDEVQRDWLERQVAASGAMSRSHFVTVALEIHLGE